MKKVNSLDDYRNKLVNKILQAASFEEIKRYLLAAINSLEKHNVNGHLVCRFIDKTLQQLNELATDSMESKQTANLRFAKIQLETLKANIVGLKTTYVPS